MELPKKGFSSVTLPSSLIGETRRVVRSPQGERFRSVSEFVAEAVTEKIAAMKGTPIVQIHSLPPAEVQRRVLNYLEKNPGTHYPSDIAFELGLEIEEVFDVVERLLKKGKLEAAKTPRIISH